MIPELLKVLVSNRKYNLEFLKHFHITATFMSILECWKTGKMDPKKQELRKNQELKSEAAPI